MKRTLTVKILKEGLRGLLEVLAVSLPMIAVLILLPGYFLGSKIDLEGKNVVLENGDVFQIERVEPNCFALFCITKVKARTTVVLPAGQHYEFGYQEDEVLVVLKDGEEFWSREANSEPLYDYLKSLKEPVPILSNGWSIELTTTFEIR